MKLFQITYLEKFSAIIKMIFPNFYNKEYPEQDLNIVEYLHNEVTKPEPIKSSLPDKLKFHKARLEWNKWLADYYQKNINLVNGG